MATKRIERVKFIIDESGSMDNQSQQIISGFNEQLQDLQDEAKKFDVEYLVSLIKFNGSITVVYSDCPLDQVVPLDENSYTPRGSTALLDAVGTAINSVPEGEKDVMLIIMTDGEENASTDYKVDEIRNKLVDCQKLGWAIVYIGAAMDVWSGPNSIGIAKSNVISYNTSNAQATYSAASFARSLYVGAKSSGMYATSCNTNLFGGKTSADDLVIKTSTSTSSNNK